MKEKQVLIKFSNGELEIDVKVSPDEDTVWLTQEDMAFLFKKNISTISRHITNIFKEEELKVNSSIAKNATQLKKYDPRTGKDRISNVVIVYYNLDVIISVGYRVKSKQGVEFRKWATSLLKEYALKGYVINASKYSLPNLEKITCLLNQARNVSGQLQLTSDDILDFLLSYNRGLKLLDDYDHQLTEGIQGSESTYTITYEECKNVIRNTSFTDKGDLFGIEKDSSFKSAIATIYQSYDGVDLYPTLEDKAANLLYFITKNHAYTDGNKRIAATIFLYFLKRNHALYKKSELRISNETLATLTILVASSNPSDKESIIYLIKLIISVE